MAACREEESDGGRWYSPLNSFVLDYPLARAALLFFFPHFVSSQDHDSLKQTFGEKTSLVH